MAEFDAIVVGLGAMGSAALYQLSRRGQHVLGLEAYTAGHQLGSHHGESRVIRLAYYEHPNYVPLLQRAYELWEATEREAGEDLLTITGGLMIGRRESELVSGALASAEQHALEYELLSPSEVERRYPALRLDAHELALFEPQAGFLRPERCIETHLSLARASGARIRYEEPVRSWQAGKDGVELRTESQSYTAHQVVFTCGARISQVLGDAIVPVRAERATLFWLEASRPDLFRLGQLPIYMWQIDGGELFYGFPHVDWPGVKVARHHTGDYCDPDLVDRAVNAADEDRLRSAIGRRLPDLARGRVLSSSVCLYEDSPDEHFLIDRLPEHPNVIYAGGFSGHGFKFASVVGEILADLVTSGEATPHARFLRADRFRELGV